jgi:hypothetical protein
MPIADMAQAAKVLAQHIKDYKINTADQLDKETGLLVNFITDLENKYSAQVAKLGLTAFVTNMKEANERVRTLTLQRTNEKMGVSVGALKTARTASDNAYRVLVKMVNALALVFGEKFSPRMTERQADALLRSDLRKLCAMFRGFGRDSLLLAALAYNVGCGKVMKSRMYAKMRSGNRNIYRDYVDFKRWNGKIVPSIERRRKMEYLLLFTP